MNRLDRQATRPGPDSGFGWSAIAAIECERLGIGVETGFEKRHDTDGLAVNYFEVEPSESVGYAYHRHLDQEEVFYVQQGIVTFETEAGEVAVKADEVIRFGPGEFQLGRNLGDERAHVLAIGTPRQSEELEYLQDCPTCEAETIQVPEITERPKAIHIHCTECDSRADEIPI